MQAKGGDFKDMLTTTAKELIERYSMQRHPGGGWFVETYRSDEQCGKLPERFGPDATRAFSTHIYYLLEDDQFDPFHRVKSDEMFHYYDGCDMTVFVIDHVNGELTRRHIGRGSKDFAITIKHGDYFAARLRHPGAGKYCLVGVTVMPGFDLRDYVEPTRAELLSLFPNHVEEITSLTKE